MLSFRSNFYISPIHQPLRHQASTPNKFDTPTCLRASQHCVLALCTCNGKVITLFKLHQVRSILFECWDLCFLSSEEMKHELHVVHGRQVTRTNSKSICMCSKRLFIPYLNITIVRKNTQFSQKCNHQTFQINIPLN